MRPIRQYAHAATIFALFWTLIAVGSLADGIDSWRHGYHDWINIAIPTVIWIIYIFILWGTFRLWRNEKPKPAQGVEGFMVDDLLDMKLEDIDLRKEAARLKWMLLGDITGFLFLACRLWQQGPKAFRGGIIFFGGVLFLHALIECIRYLFLRNRSRKNNRE